jgi:deoxycytidylate deaminase
MAMAEVVRLRSKDTAFQVGSIMMRTENREIYGYGYNGFIAGEDDNAILQSQRDSQKDYLQHAETNCIHFATETDLKDACVFVTCFPCKECTLKLIQKRVKTVVVNMALEKFLYPSLDYLLSANVAVVSMQAYNGIKGSNYLHVENVSKEAVCSSFDYMFMVLAAIAANRSRSPPTIWGGCAIVKSKRVIGYGFSGTPQSLSNATVPVIAQNVKKKGVPANDPKEVTRYQRECVTTAHIDCVRNALYFTTVDVKDAELYCTRIPTKEALKEAVQRGVKKITFIKTPNRNAKPPTYVDYLTDAEYTKALADELDVLRLVALTNRIQVVPFEVRPSKGDVITTVNPIVKYLTTAEAEDHYKKLCQDETYKEQNIDKSVIIPPTKPEHLQQIKYWEGQNEAMDKSNKKMQKERSKSAPTTPF